MEDERVTPENTTRRDPLLHLLGARSSPEPDTYITGMEAQGQRELLASEVIPAQVRNGSDESLTALGFTLGAPVGGDPLFRYAQLPEGWSKQPGGGSVWSVIVDQHGRRRCDVYYKAAWYDRKASLSIVSVGSYVRSACEGGQPLILDDIWATRDLVLAALASFEQEEEEGARHWRLSDHEMSGQFEAEHEASRALFAECRAKIEQTGVEVTPLRPGP